MKIGLGNVPRAIRICDYPEPREPAVKRGIEVKRSVLIGVRIRRGVSETVVLRYFFHRLDRKRKIWVEKGGTGGSVERRRLVFNVGISARAEGDCGKQVGSETDIDAHR